MVDYFKNERVWDKVAVLQEAMDLGTQFRGSTLFFPQDIASGTTGHFQVFAQTFRLRPFA
jgi:hypothetical protein